MACRLRSCTTVATSAPWSSSAPSELRITRVSRRVARRLGIRAGLMFAGRCWWRSLAIDGGSGTSGGHAPEIRRPSLIVSAASPGEIHPTNIPRVDRVCACVRQPPAARRTALGLFGRKRLFIIGVVGFAVASAVGGAASGFGMLVIARVAQGAFAAMLAPGALSMLSVTFADDGKERGRAFGIFGAISGAGGALGLTSVQVPIWRPGNALVSVRR